MRFISILLLCSVLAGCEAYRGFSDGLARTIAPEEMKAYDAQVKPQKKSQ